MPQPLTMRKISTKWVYCAPKENYSKAGSGLYFWNYESNHMAALELSKQWWDFALNKANLYDKSQDCSFSTI